MRVKTSYAFDLKTGATANTETGRIQYAVPVDYCAANYYRRDNGANTKVTNSPTYMEPFYRLLSVFDWFRVYMVKLEYFPAVDSELTSAQNVQNKLPLWVGIDAEDSGNSSNLTS